MTFSATLVLATACASLRNEAAQLPVRVFSTRGEVVNAEAGLCADDGASVTLDWKIGQKRPVVAYDFGGKTVGGYAVFRVTGFTPQAFGESGEAVGNPVLRLSYSTHPDGLRETGDFTRRGCIDYLGPTFDNPVLPANVNRFELYTVARTGVFVAPLVQGQERYLRVQLETPGTSVSVDAFEIRNVGVFSREPPVGAFRCSDARINRVWDMSAWTCQIASIPNNDAWRVVAGRLLPRKLERSAFAGFHQVARWTTDGVLGADFELRTNPHYPSAFGLALRARDDDDCVVVVASQPSFVRILRRRGGRNELLAQKVLGRPIVDGVVHRLEARVAGSTVAAVYDGVKIVEAPVTDLGTDGRFGFYIEKEWWPVVRNVSVEDARGVKVFSDDFSSADDEGRLPHWDYTRSFKFLSDGGKRDRLAWLGDLWWAQRTVYGAFGPNEPYLRETLRLFAHYQTPEGYVWAAPFAERGPRPRAGEYGHFPSDEFAAWLPSVTWDHFLHTDDRLLMETLYPSVKGVLRYLCGRCSEDGLFVQQMATSSNISSMAPMDVTTRFYTQLVVWKAFADGARLAQALGHAEEAAAWSNQSERMASAIRSKFWSEKELEFCGTLGEERGTSWSRAMALASKFATEGEARLLARKIPMNGASKCHLLALRGLFEYGYDEAAYDMIEGGSWFRLSDPSWAGAQCCTECGFLVRDGFWDESHPDTTIGGPFVNYLLGVEPLSPGFTRFRFAPHLVSKLSFAEGKIPTPHGFIEARWCTSNDVFRAWLTVPEGTEAQIAFPPELVIEPGSLDIGALGTGRHEIRATGLGRLFAARKSLAVEVSTGTGDAWYEAAPANRCRDTDPQAEFIQTIDLGQMRTLKELEWKSGAQASYPSDVVVSISADGEKWTCVKELTGLKWKGYGAKRSVDLHTAGADLEARYVRLSMRGPQGFLDRDGLRYYAAEVLGLRVRCGE